MDTDQKPPLRRDERVDRFHCLHEFIPITITLMPQSYQPVRTPVIRSDQRFADSELS